MNFIKKVILYIYNFLFIQYYPNCELKIHKNINRDPIIIINGMYNLQVSSDCFIKELDIFNMTYLFNLLPGMNARMNAIFLYNKIYGGYLEIGKYSEYSEGIYPTWSNDSPISFFCHSYGGNIIIELINILVEKGLDPDKMINKVVFLSPTFISQKSNYILYQDELLKNYLKICEYCKNYPLIKYIYTPRNNILKKNKCENLSIPVLKKYNINNMNVFDTTSDLNYNISAIDFLKKHKITYRIYVGCLLLEKNYILYNLLISPLYIFSSIKINLPNINIFDGMNYYDLKFCQKNNINIVDSLGHFDLYFDINPCTFARNKLFYYEVIKYLRNNKI